MEHVCADEDTWTYRIQRIVNPIYSRLGDGCSLTRKPWLHIDNAGFSHIEHERVWSDSKLLGFYRPHLIGKATK